MDDEELTGPPEGGEPDISSGGDTGENQELIAGKFKSVDELVNSYKEAERKITELGNIKTQYEQKLADYENRSAHQTTEQQSDPNAAVQQLNDEFFENPVAAFMKLQNLTISQMRAQEKAARANVKREISSRKNDPLFHRVADDFEAELESVADEMLANPESAKQVADYIYDRVCGRYARSNASKAKEDPVERRRYLQDLGVSEPEKDEPKSKGDVQTDGVDMLRGLGLSGKMINEVSENYRKRGDE